MDIQALVDAFAVELERGVSIDDLSGTLIAHSAQHGQADEARVRALLDRAVAPELRDWEMKNAVAVDEALEFIPENASLGLSRRLCLVLIHEGVKVGRLYVILRPNDELVTVQGHLAAVHELARALSARLYEDALSGTERGDTPRHTILMDACSGDPRGRVEIERWPAVRATSAMQLLVAIGPRSLDRNLRPPQRRLMVLQAAGVVLKPIAQNVGDSHAVFLLRAPIDRPSAYRFRERLVAATEGAGVANSSPRSLWTVGLSSAITTGAPDPQAYGQAVAACQAAAVDPRFESVAHWDDIGVFQILSTLPPESEVQDISALQRLENEDGTGELRETLEAVFDSTGDMASLAREMNIHRTTLYYRLSRIKRILGDDALGGPQRLLFHLALKLNRWRGRPRL